MNANDYSRPIGNTDPVYIEYGHTLTGGVEMITSNLPTL